MPNIVIINEEDKNCLIVDMAIHRDSRLSEKEGEKVEKYQDLKREIKYMEFEKCLGNTRDCWRSRWRNKKFMQLG